MEALAVRLAQENCRWWYDRIAGALANPRYAINDRTVGNIKRHGVPPAPEREKTTTWKACIRTHLYVLAATDCFTAEVWTQAGLRTYPIFFSCIFPFSSQGNKSAGPIQWRKRLDGLLTYSDREAAEVF